MIDVKIIKKPKNKAATPTLRTPGAAYGDKSVKEAVHASKADMAKMAEKASLAEQAEHARKADEATRADEANHAQAANEANHARMADEVSLEAKTLTHFLRNDIPNTAAEVVTFLKGIVAKAVSFFQGIVNSGDIKNNGDITNTGNISNAGDITNSGNIMTKNLTVTGKATFFELEIQKAKAAGGMSVNSAGTFHIDAVEETADGFVCYQRAEKDGVTLLQTCEPKDQMMCSNGMNSLPLPLQGRGGPTNDGKPHAIGNHYYWRLATDAPKRVVTHTIDGKEEKCLKLVLSKTDRHKRPDESPQDIGDIPKVGDDLVQIGNRENKERQSVMMSCAYNSFDPELKPSYWAHYMGVNDYDISKHRYTWFAANGSQVTGNFKVQSDNGGLESIEDYMKILAQESSTRPNLLWGSDLNLDGVDTTSKAAIEKHLGVVLSNGIELGNRDMFEYLKGGGVSGADAIRIKNAYKREGWGKWTNIRWQDVPLKPRTRYTISVWVKFKSYGRKGRMYVDCASDDGRYCFGGYLHKEHYYDRADIDEWQRVRYVFDSGASKRLSSLFFSCIADEEEGAQCEIWFCHPKLEEGEVATPWCAYDGTTGHSLVAKVFMEGSYRNGLTKGVKNYVRVFYDGQEVTDFKASYRYKGAGYSNWSEPEIKSSDAWCDAQRDGSTLLVEYTVEYKGLKALATGRLDNIQDGRDAVSYKLIPVDEKVLAYLTDSKEKKVDVRLKYKIMKSAGERVSFVTDLAAEGMVLTEDGGLGGFGSAGGEYGLERLNMEYKERPDDRYVVTLTKDGRIVDRRVLPITFKPKVVFDIDTKNGTITSQIEAANGRINSVEQNINETKSTVGKLDEQYSQLKVKSDEISMTVNNGTRPNLLWGSDLDLSGVQDVMERAYAQGDIIKKKTEEKAEWKRSRDNADSDDDRMRYQEGMDDCDSKIAQAQGEVAKCRAAIGKRLGVGLNATKVDNTEWFEYLKGGGVGGADALKFKAMKDTSEFAGLYWEIATGAARNLQLKPNTVYTLSAWVRTDFDSKAQGYGAFSFEAFKKEKEDSAQRVGRLSFKTASSWSDPINEWTRVSTSFTTEELKYGSVAMWMNGTKPSTLYLCHPKLEEGDTATPWCAYDGTVDALLAGGFDIKEKKFTATADNFVVRNNRGEKTFMVDENGKINHGMLSLDGLDAKRAVIKNLRFQSNSVAPYFVTEESMKEFAAYCTRRYAGYNVHPLFPFDVATFFVFLIKPKWLIDIDQGYNRDFSPRNRGISVSKDMARSFSVDYSDFALELFWHNMVGKTVTIANATNENITFGAKLKTKVSDSIGKNVMQIGGRLDNLPSIPGDCVEFVTLSPGQMASYRYTVLSGAHMKALVRGVHTKGFFLLQDLFDFSYYKKLFEVGYDTEQGFNLFDKKYLDLFNTDKERVAPKGGFPETKR